MPKDTFLNLNEDKKRKIFDAAVEEFSVHRFSEASINQIIKTAGISRGSFYQYFDDKEDIYLYILAEIGKEKMEILEHVEQPGPDADFFENFLHMYKVALEWAKQRPKYNEIGMLMVVDNSDFITKLRAMSTKGFDMLKGMIERDKQRGLIRQEIDTELIVDVQYTLLMHLLTEYQQAGNYEGMLHKITDIFEILKHGISVPSKAREDTALEGSDPSQA